MPVNRRVSILFGVLAGDWVEMRLGILVRGLVGVRVCVVRCRCVENEWPRCKRALPSGFDWIFLFMRMVWNFDVCTEV